MDRHAAGNEFLVGYFELARPAEKAVQKVERMHDVELATAGIEGLSIRRKGQTGKRLFENHAAANPLLFRLEINQHDSMVAIASMQDCQPFAARMQGHVDRKITKVELLASRLDGPCVRQTDGAVRFLAWQYRFLSSKLARFVCERWNAGKDEAEKSYA